MSPHILDDLLVTGAVVSVAMVVPHRVASVNPAHQLPGLSSLTQLCQARAGPLRLTCVFVNSDDAQWKKEGEEDRHKTNSTNSIIIR